MQPDDDTRAVARPSFLAYLGRW